jgi:hypothetical protein
LYKTSKEKEKYYIEDLNLQCIFITNECRHIFSLNYTFGLQECYRVETV